MNALIYKADDYFVKMRKGTHQDIAVAILKLLLEHGIQEIIKPIPTITNQSILYIEGYSLVVYPFIQGNNGFQQALTRQQWKTLGQALKKIHEMDVPDTLKQQLRHESYSSKWRKNVHSLRDQMEQSPALDEYALQFIQFTRKKIEIIDILLAYAEELVLKAQQEPSPFVLCHGDIHAGNLLLGSKDCLYIVDWDEPLMAPKERDLMFVGGGVANVWNKPYEEALFYEGYGKTNINQIIFAYYRCERILEDIALYTQEILSSSSWHKAQSYSHFVDMFAVDGVVDIALRTAEKIQ